nr:MarR family transcriptional regulator [uncultured Christensenella sp.]
MTIPSTIDSRHAVFGSLFLLSTKLEAIGNDFLDELTVKQWFFLAVLTAFFKEPPTVGQLAAQMGNSHQNVKQLALRLEEKGFIDIRKDTSDRRVLRIVPLEKAQEYEKLHHAKNEIFLKTLFEGFSSTELKKLQDGLASLYENLLQMQGENK